MSQLLYGTIVASAPEYGVALVQLGDGAPSMASLVIGHLPYQDAGYGVVRQDQLAEGTAVACMSHIDDSSSKVYIIGPVNHATGEKDDHLLWRNFYNTNVYQTSDTDEALTAVLDGLLSQTQLLQFRDHAHSVDRDALPGDFDLRDKFGANGLHIGRLLSQLHGSPLAYIDVEAVYNTSRRVSDVAEDHTLLTVDITAPEYKISNIAINESEAFGLKTKVPFEKDGDDNIKLAYNAAIPFYRITNIAGAGADGVERLVLTFPKDKEIHNSSAEPQILAKQRVSLTGAMSQASAASISSIKAPALTGILQLGYGGKSKADPDNPSFDDTLEAYTASVPDDDPPATPDPADAIISDAAINKVIAKLLSDDYIKVLRQRMLDNGLKASDESKVFGKMYFDAKDLEPIGGAITEQQYSLPKQIQLQDPVTGKKQTYYASTSFITQEEDGSILIADGYGSEIRMSRGNIYISPALDLFLRPGRDLSAMVPRHQAYNSQGSCTLNSDDSMYLHATRDLKMSGATNKTGVVVLESRSESTDGGLIVKSNSNVSVTGTNLYLGRNSHSKMDKGKVTTPSNPGMIVIDAGTNGTISETSRAHTIDTKQFTALSVDGRNSAITLTSGKIGLYANEVTMPAVLNMQTLGGEQSANIYKDGKVQQITLASSSSPFLVLNGSIKATGSIVCNGSGKFSKGITAKGVQSISEMNTVPKRRNGEVDYDVFQEFAPDRTQVTHVINSAVSEQVKQAADIVYQDYYVVGNEFAFPTTYDIDSKLRMPGMLWQTISETKSGTNSSLYIWKERYIKGIDGTQTACYPGIDVWENAEAVISTTGYKTKNLKNGYIMNAERTNKDGDSK